MAGPVPARQIDAGADRVVRHGRFPAELVSIAAVFTAD